MSKTTDPVSEGKGQGEKERARERGNERKGGRGVFFSAPPPSLVSSFLLALLVLLFCRAQPAQGQEVRAHLPADSVSIGERFRFALAAEHRADAAYFPHPAMGDTLLGDLEVIARIDTSRRTQAGSMRVDSVVYEVTTFALDSAYVPPLPVRFVSDGDTLLAVSQPVVVPVRSAVPSGAESPRDLAPLAPFSRAWWPWLLGLAAALALLAAAFYAWRRYRARGEAAPGEPALPPYEQAEKRLRALEDDEALYHPSRAKPFYVELSDVTRRYLARRRGLPALEKTTREVIDALRGEAEQNRVPGDAPERLRRVLSQADLVKFADERPDTKRNRAMLEETQSTLEAIEQHVLAQEREAARRREEESEEDKAEAPAG